LRIPIENDAHILIPEKAIVNFGRLQTLVNSSRPADWQDDRYANKLYGGRMSEAHRYPNRLLI
jgi:hypothetical protein